jgi:hypothetical protein
LPGCRAGRGSCRDSAEELDALDRAVRIHLDDPCALVIPPLSRLTWGRKPGPRRAPAAPGGPVTPGYRASRVAMRAVRSRCRALGFFLGRALPQRSSPPEFNTLCSHGSTDSHQRFSVSRARGRRRDGNPTAIAAPGRSGSACRRRHIGHTVSRAVRPLRPGRPQALRPRARMSGTPCGTAGPVIVSFASRRYGAASPRPRAGTGASRLRRGPPAAARAAPTMPPRPKSPGTTTPPAYASSGLHQHSQAGQAPASSCSSGSPAGRNELTPGQRRSSCLAAPGQGPDGNSQPARLPVALKVLLQLAEQTSVS